jgi:hypothetical protein
VGTVESNLTAVVKDLTQKGIDARRLAAVGQAGVPSISAKIRIDWLPGTR